MTNTITTIALMVLALLTATTTTMMIAQIAHADQPDCTGICRHFSDHLPANGNAFVQVCDLKGFENPVCY